MSSQSDFPTGRPPETEHDVATDSERPEENKQDDVLKRIEDDFSSTPSGHSNPEPSTIERSEAAKSRVKAFLDSITYRPGDAIREAIQRELEATSKHPND